MNFFKKNILIMGYGKSGQSATKLLKKFKNKLFIYDKKLNIKILKLNNKNILYENNLKNILKNKIHFCIISPGIDLKSEEVKLIKNKKIKIISELQLGAFFCKGKIIAVTGTNGKTTTVNLLYQIFKQTTNNCYLCGNMGIPITEIALKTNDDSIIICEVSSFQLETSANFYPHTSLILNITPDHLDRHKNMNNYINIKNKINKNFKTKKYFNCDDKNTKKLSKKYFNAKIIKLNNKKYNYLIKNNNLIGKFNLNNILCAVTIAKDFGVKDKEIFNAVKKFKGLSHRLERVDDYNGIIFINDSKSTNINSTLVAIRELGENIILLLGGSSKDLDFSPIFKNKIHTTICYGETKDQIAKYAQNTNLIIKDKFEDACNSAFNLATSGQIVLLSPACASFDEFTGFEQRGEMFCKLVSQFINNHTFKI